MRGFGDYEIIASGSGEKLECWGDIILLRPDPQAIWDAKFDLSKYDGLHARYIRSSSGGGEWQIHKKVPKQWTIKIDDYKFIISPTSFKHTGLFPEQSVNWRRIDSIIRAEKKARMSRNAKTKTESAQNSKIGNNAQNNKTENAQNNKENIAQDNKIEVLNLFGYTGGATVASAYAGARVTHVDASRGMVEVCKQNCALNNIASDAVRYIVDDCIKFTAREIRRGKKYDAIIMDPPSFGRGSGGEVWKIEESLQILVRQCCELLSDDPLFFIINSYTSGLQPTVIRNVLYRSLTEIGYVDPSQHKDTVNLENEKRKTSEASQNSIKDKTLIQGKDAFFDVYELGIPTCEDIVLPAGCSVFCLFWDAERKHARDIHNIFMGFMASRNEAFPGM